MGRKCLVPFPEEPGRRCVHEDCRSEILGNTRTISVHLPPGYDREPERRYPVLYLHDGQNVFDDERAAFGVSWRIGETADRLTCAGRIRPVILVGIDNTEHRLDEYALWRDEGQEAGGYGEEYGRFVVEEVKAFVDREYRTLPGRANTAVLGSSMGGLISLTMACLHQRVFSRCGVLSPSLWWADERVLRELEGHHRWMRRTRFWLCMGTREDKQRGPVTAHLRRTRRLVAIFDEARLVPGKDYCYWEVAGGEHKEAAWAARIDKVLLYFYGW